MKSDYLGSNPGSATSDNVLLGKLFGLSGPLRSHFYNWVMLPRLVLFNYLIQVKLLDIPSIK